MKEKKQKRFANAKMIIDLIKKFENDLYNLPATKIQIEKREIDWGDKWREETGYEYLIFFSDKSAYLVGETIIVEDCIDWEQAESWKESHCRDYYQERGQVPFLEVLEKLEKVIFQDIEKR